MADDQHQPDSDKPSEGVAGTVVGYLIAGIVGWGVIGWLVERWLGLPKGMGIATGMIIGAGGAIYLIMKRLGA
ncbi:MAG: hypothetical protein DIU79_06505 [Actinobacteria bacterium]|nr:MAG: hypothetical protein DIU79_06505 [Actinomycetota bacterium]